MSDYKLTAHDKDVVAYNSDIENTIVKSFIQMQKFKLHDVLVVYDIYRDTNQRVLRLSSSYNSPMKFKVVYISDMGVAYVKQLNTKGNPSGNLCSLLSDGDGYGNPIGAYGSDIEITLDPDFVDATLFQEEDKYDPTEDQKIKRSLFKDVAAHNKLHKISLNSLPEVIAFMGQINPSEHRTFWVSEKSGWTIMSVSNDSKKSFKDFSYRPLKSKTIPRLRVRTSKGEEKWIDPLHLLHTNLYHSQPRSYRKELKNPK